MQNEPYTERADGVVLRKGDWLLIESFGVGRFSGCYENPTLGWMAYLSFYRSFEKPEERNTLYLKLDSDNIRAIMAKAVIVSGSMTAAGKRPKPISTGTVH